MHHKEDSMNQTLILLTSMTIGFISWAIIANFWLIPWLKINPFHKGLALLTIPHVFRYIGLSFLITGVTSSPLDPRFASPAAYGDLLAAVLALVAVMALLMKSRYSVSLLWIFNILGFIDFLVAVIQGLRYTHPAEMGATYFIPILAVPPLFVSHLLIFWVLIIYKSHKRSCK
jgi:hypothetical protein